MVNSMRKARSSKKKKRTKGRNRQCVKVSTEAVNILRTVGDHEAFYFYEAVGKPTGEIARNLSDFLDRVKYVNSESLAFHLERGDFQNWIETTIGDSKLAGKLGKISSSNTDDTRMSICRAVENRIKELGGSSLTVLTNESSAVLLPPC